MRRSVKQGELHVSMVTAAAVAYRDIMGEPLTPTGDVRTWNETLHAVAHALSSVCRVYSTTEDGKMFQISALDLVDGRFDHGGALLRVADGTVHRKLTVSREELYAGIVLLKHIGVKFGPRPER